MSKNRLLVLFAAAALPVLGGTITVDATASGRYFDTNSFDTGYGTGWHSGIPAEARSFFGFNLSGVSGTITGATLHLQTSAVVASFLSPTGTETFGLFDVSATLASLAAGTAFASFGDLGSGTSYGSLVVNSAPGTFVDIILNANGIAYLNGLAGGTAVLGGALTTLAKGAAPNNEILFNGSSSTMVRQLVLDTTPDSGVPEPATWVFIASGLALGGLVRRRK